MSTSTTATTNTRTTTAPIANPDADANGTAPFVALPPERQMHTTDVFQLLDAKLRRIIDRVIEQGWSPTDAFREPRDLIAAISYCARLRGAHQFARFAAAHLVFPRLVDRDLITAVAVGASRAQQHAEQALDVEVVRVAVRRALHAGASWTAKIYLRPLSPTATTPRETRYACELVGQDGHATGELHAVIDTFGDPAVLDLDRGEHVLLLRDRFVGRKARAITRDDQTITSHLLQFESY